MASEETQKKKRRTGDMCSLSFCSKRLKDNVSIHKPPKDPEIRKKWFNFVAKTRENVSKLNTVYVCSDHFTEDDYTINPSQFGLFASGETDVRFRRTLKRGVVPSIYPTPTEEQLQKEKQFSRAAKSRGISIPKTTRPSLASLKKDKSGERKIKRKHDFDKLAGSRVSIFLLLVLNIFGPYFYCGMIGYIS